MYTGLEALEEIFEAQLYRVWDTRLRTIPGKKGELCECYMYVVFE